MSDDAVVELDVGALAGNGQCDAHVSCRWDGQGERRASSLDGKWKAGIEAHGKFGIAGKDGCVDAIFEKQRKWLVAVARIPNGHALGGGDVCNVRCGSLAISW